MIPYSGLHFQKPINDWPRAAVQLPAGTWIKAIDNVQILDEAKRVNPGVKTVLRHWDGGWHQFEKGTLEAYKAHARAFFDTFIDLTFMDYAHNVDAIEGLNEFNAASHNSAEIAERVKWVQASCMVWANEYRTRAGLAHIRLVSSNTAVGNDIPLEAARAIADYGAIAAYHPYVPTQNKQIRSGEWQWYSGRWTEMDKRYRAAGITVEWLFTEAGPIGYTGDHLLANDGWRHANVCDGDVNALLAVVKYWMDRATLWNYEYGGRALGQVLYNSGGADNEWKLFEIAQPSMDTVAAFNRDYVPPPPPPPPEPEPPPPPDNIPLPDGIIDYVDQLPMNTESDDWPYKTRPLSAVENVIIHHSVGQPTTPPESIAIGHINRNGGGADGWPGIGYHFYILGDGTIYKTNHLTTHSYHVGTYNRVSVGVCLAGDFTTAHPLPAQLAATRYLLTWLDDVLGLPALTKHKDFSNTQCPGNSWSEWFHLLTEEPVDEPEQRRYARTYHLLPQDARTDELAAVVEAAYEAKQTVGYSVDDAFVNAPELTKRTVHVWDVARIVNLPDPERELEKWVENFYPPLPTINYRRVADLFIAEKWSAPVGTKAERAGDLWPGSWFDANPFLNHYSLGYHTGSDLNNNSVVWDYDRNMPVWAAANGRVTYAGIPSNGWQRVVVVEHRAPDGSRSYSRYAHLGDIVVNERQWLKRGEMLGIVGRNMTSDGPGPFHLHFDVSHTSVLLTNPGHWPGENRQAVVDNYRDPKAWIQARI